RHLRRGRRHGKRAERAALHGTTDNGAGIMTHARKLWPLLTATHRYDKSISTHGRGAGQTIEAPILAYLVETPNGRILYDVGCDHRKIDDPALRARYYNPETFQFGAPEMNEDQRIPS